MSDGIHIRGSQLFRERTQEALSLLSATKTFLSVKLFLSAIREGRMSYLHVSWGKTTFLVGYPTWQAPVIWYASGIVHEAGHGKLYREKRRRLFKLHFFNSGPHWAGTEAERFCCRLQLAALSELGAPEYMKRHVEALMENPKYHLASPCW